MKVIENYCTVRGGQSVFTSEYINSLRKADAKTPNPLKIISQVGGQEKLLSTPADITIYGGMRGGGKGQRYDSEVVTPFGVRKIGDLKIGSVISDTQGRMQKVICITELGVTEVFRLHFSDGTFTDCTKDHLWKIKQSNVITKSRKINNGSQDDDWRLWTFEMIKDFLDKQERGEIDNGARCKRNLLIPLCEPVNFTKPKGRGAYPGIHPYLLGVLIGDGMITGSTGYTAVITSADKEIIDKIEDLCGIAPVREQVNHCNGKAMEYFYSDFKLKEELKRIGLFGCKSHNKFIPEYYKYTSVEDRFFLMQGLMDTDGYIDSRGHCSYTTISERLANDVAFILRSLGAYVTISRKKAGYKDGDGNYIQCNDAFELYIKIKDSHRLFNLNRKKTRYKPFNGGVSTPLKRILSYEFVGYDKCRCILVSNPNALYLTNDFIVTHNSYALLMEALKDIKNPNLRSVVMRHEINDLSDLVETSYKVYSQYGKYNKSKNDMRWNFDRGGFLEFSYHADSLQDFKLRFQGRQYSYVGIDEITHMDYPKFKYIITDNRNAFGIRNRLIGTCNPDPDSWVAQFIDWWIAEDGYPIPERDGVVRYCFMDGEEVTSIYWGDTREEVYEQCKDTIDKIFKPEYAEYGSPQELFIKSVTFIEGKLSDNKQLLRSDPTYLANLANQSEEQRARDLDGNWKYRSLGDDIIKLQHMENFYKNYHCEGDGVRRVSCDVAFEGGDFMVMWLWVGNHIQDLYVCQFNAKAAVNAVKTKLKEWHVSEENFTYDLNGLGQVFKGFFPKAVPFNNRESVADEFKYIYANLKSQAAYMFAQAIINGEISINPDLVNRKITTRHANNVPLHLILNKERKAIRQNLQESDKGWSIIKKSEMKSLVGNSPDFIEAMFMFFVFLIKKKKHVKPRGLLRYVSSPSQLIY